MTTIKKKPAIIGVKPIVVCRYCGACSWGYTVQKTVEIDLLNDKVTQPITGKTEIRCSKCSIKATRQQAAQIQAMSIFGKVKGLEVNA